MTEGGKKKGWERWVLWGIHWALSKKTIKFL